MAQDKNIIKYIDIASTIKETDSALLKKLPPFVVKILTKIVMQEPLNKVLSKHQDKVGFDFLNAMIKEFNLNIEISGLDNLPEDGRCFFAANHPFGIIDGLILTHTVYNKYGKLQAIANDAFRFIPHLNPLITEVNVFGGSSKDHITALNNLYNSEFPITHFPSGEVSRKFHGKIQDTDWQKSFISKSVSSKRNIVPILFDGKNSKLFYTVFSLRQKLGIKLNIELILLIREMFNKQNTTIKVFIGKPIPYATFNSTMPPQKWAQFVKNKVYELKN